MQEVRDLSDTSATRGGAEEQGWATARTLAEALPYIQQYDRETVVIKYGGHAMGQEETARLFAADSVLLKLLGLHPVVVHGGGPQISRMLDKAGVNAVVFRGTGMFPPDDSDTILMVGRFGSRSRNRSN